MPELPELEAFTHYVTIHCLHKPILGVSISDVRVLKGASSALFKKTLVGDAFASAERKGKFLIIHLQKSDKLLVMHFGLTGFLTYTKNAKEKVRFSTVAFEFKDHSVLHWNSVRKFERIWLVDSLADIKELKTLGPDPLKITAKAFSELLEKNRSKNIKALLMDQRCIAGIGNEYSDEILFQAGIDPHHTVKDLTPAQCKTLYKKMKSVLTYFKKVRLQHLATLEHGYFSKDDRAEFKASTLQAHRHVDMICPRNKNHTLKTASIAGRTSYYCPEDQK